MNEDLTTTPEQKTRAHPADHLTDDSAEELQLRHAVRVTYPQLDEDQVDDVVLNLAHAGAVISSAFALVLAGDVQGAGLLLNDGVRAEDRERSAALVLAVQCAISAGVTAIRASLATGDVEQSIVALRAQAALYRSIADQDDGDE
jgi:hypothetical protein